MPKEALAKCLFVILSAAKDLAFSATFEILRSLRFLRMTGMETFARGSKVFSDGGIILIPPTPL
jgi:hypothetical protein